MRTLDLVTRDRSLGGPMTSNALEVAILPCVRAVRNRLGI